MQRRKALKSVRVKSGLYGWMIEQGYKPVNQEIELPTGKHLVHVGWLKPEARGE